MISNKVVQNLIEKVNEHSSNICILIDKLKHVDRSDGSFEEEIAIQNTCIQDVLVSFTDCYLTDRPESPSLKEARSLYKMAEQENNKVRMAYYDGMIVALKHKGTGPF